MIVNDTWYKNYIKGINIRNIEYLNFTNDELLRFYLDNYYDIKTGEFVSSFDDSIGWLSPIGMYFLNFEKMIGMKYVLGITDNLINKKTIVSALCYIDDFVLFPEQIKYLTYLSTTETNFFFRGSGLYKELIENSYQFIPKEQNILISELSKMGNECHVDLLLENIFKQRGFLMDIRSDTVNFDEVIYFDFLKKKGIVKERKL